MAHPDRPSSQSSSKASESLDTALDLTVEGLEAAKDYIVDVLSVAGVGVALNAAISILKKVQVCGLSVLLCTGAEWGLNNRLQSQTAMH